MFLSLDMTAISCSGSSDAAVVTSLIVQYASHPAQLRLPTGEVFVSAFAGDGCNWGGMGNAAGWVQAVKTGPAAAGITTKFVPSFWWSDGSYSAGGNTGFIDGAFPVSVPLLAG